MATGGDVLTTLCAGVEWTIHNDDYESIIWNSGTPAITKAQFLAGFATADAAIEARAQAVLDARASRDAKLAKMGFTLEEIANW
jgi:hypothetical protein